MEKKIVDARGLACPLPVVNAKKAVGEFTGDGVLTVLVDNEIAVQNLKKFAAQRGLAAAGEKKAEKEYEVTIQVHPAGSSPSTKTAGTGGMAAANALSPDGNRAGANSPDSPLETGAQAGQGSAPEVCSPDTRQKGMVVILSANVMGSGEAKLGQALMKAFVFALTRQDVLPETVLCYNSGACLTCEGSESLEDFRELEAQGVNILTCGTCLDYYGIKEKLAVGTVTNMYEIVEVLEQARSVIRP